MMTSVTFSWKQRRVRESWKSRHGWENWCSENPRTWRTGINSFWRTFQPWGGRIWQSLLAWRQLLSSKDDPWWASVLWNLIFMIIEFFYGSDIYLSDKIYKYFTSLFLLPLKNEYFGRLNSFLSVIYKVTFDIFIEDYQIRTLLSSTKESQREGVHPALSRKWFLCGDNTPVWILCFSCICSSLPSTAISFPITLFPTFFCGKPANCIYIKKECSSLL